MEFRWAVALYIVGTLILGFALISDSKDPKGFPDLICDSPSDCSIGVEDCQLIRCDCPVADDNYCKEIDKCSPSCILSQLRTNSCCDFIPTPFHDKNILHFLHIEKYTNVITENLNNIFVKVMIWSREAAESEKDFKLIRTNLINADNSSDPAIPTTLSISDAVPPATVTDIPSTLDSIDVIPVNESNLYNGLQDLSPANQPCMKSLDCSEGLTTKCACHQCKIFSADFPEPADKNYTSTPEGWYNLEVSNDYATNITTSSDLSALHNPSSVNRWDEGTFGGWAPDMSDTDMWVSFHGLKANICGIAIQGMAGSTYRSLDKFNISSGAEGGGFVTYNGDPITYQSGVVLHSISTHYFPEPIDGDCLQINVVEPTDPLRVGFRPGLIACEEETPYCQSEQVCALVKTVVDTFEKAFKGELPELTPTNDSTKLKQEINKDPAGTVVFVSSIVSSVLQNNDEDLPANFSAKITIESVDISIEGREPALLQNEGFTLNVNPLESGDDGGTVGGGGGGGGGGGDGDGDSSDDEDANKISISVPPEAFGDIDLKESVVFVVAVTQPNKSVPVEPVDVAQEQGEDENVETVYELASPVVMINTFIGKTATKLKSFAYTMHYRNGSGTPRCAFFDEQNKQWNETIEWGFEGCEITDNRTILKADCLCNHTTSYAVLLSLGESKLEGEWKVVGSAVTYIGCGLSIVALIAALVIYFVLRSSISAARYAIHTNLMVALLLSTSLFVSGLIQSRNDAICVITKYLLQYLFTASFCWMLSEGLHLYRQIITVFESEKKQTWIYFAVGWAVPIILVLIGLVGSQMMNAHLPPTKTAKDGTKSRICFYSYENKTVLFVFAPILLIVVVNVCILIRVTLVVIKAVKIQAEKDSSEKITQVKAGVRSSLLLMPLLGCTHILAFVITVDGSLEILYNVFNSLQGFFIALFYCGMNTEVRNAITQYIRRSKDANTIQGSTTGLRVNSETTKSKGLFGKKNKVQPTTQFTFTEGSSRVSDDLAPCQG